MLFPQRPGLGALVALVALVALIALIALIALPEGLLVKAALALVLP